MVQAEREGRIIILYHSIAMAIVAIEVYMITSLLKMKPFFKTAINAIITVGYMLTMVFGLGFAYFGHNWAFHGLYIAGLSLIFFAGVMLVIALWPWNPEYYVTDKEYAHTRKGVDLERVAFFATALTTVISALFGAVPGSFFGNGFEVFLAENIIRYPEKTTMEYSVIGHLHIMLALIAIMITLIIGRWLNFKGHPAQDCHAADDHRHDCAQSGGVGRGHAARTDRPHDHLRRRNAFDAGGAAAADLEMGQADPRGHGTSPETNVRAEDQRAGARPARFGPTWQMLFMNFTTSGIGIFMAIRLDEIFRVWPAREERIELTGHWHVLSAIIATIILLYYGDMIGLKGKVRQWYGWSIIVLSDIAFAAVTVFEMKRLFISEAEQQPLVNVLMYAMDFGLGMLLRCWRS